MSAGYCHRIAEALETTGLVSGSPDLAARSATTGAEGIIRTMATIATRRREDEIDIGITVLPPVMNSSERCWRLSASRPALSGRHHAETDQKSRPRAGTAIRTTACIGRRRATVLHEFRFRQLCRSL